MEVRIHGHGARNVAFADWKSTRRLRNRPSRLQAAGANLASCSFLMLLTALAACSSTAVDPSDGLNGIDVGLPARTRAPDLARLTERTRREGGNVFVRLTGEPTALALEVLSRAGLTAAHVPDPPPGIVTFDSLRIATVWGFASASAISRIAALRFVIMLESSSDPDGIGAMVLASIANASSESPVEPCTVDRSPRLGMRLYGRGCTALRRLHQESKLEGGMWR